MEPIDAVNLEFGAESLNLLNLILAFIMFGVALPLRLADFKRIATRPKAILGGLFAQLLLLPALTFCLILLLKPATSIAMGMILVSCCPGGNTSNFITHLAKGNTALSVSLTAISSVLAFILTPLNFGFWAGNLPDSGQFLDQLSLDLGEITKTVLFVLVLPLILGMYTGIRFPAFSAKAEKPVKFLSILVFIGFVVIAFSGNTAIFAEWIGPIFVLVLLHNALAMLGGFSVAKLLKLPGQDQRTLAIETGIQNSGLGLILVFQHFDGIGGMAVLTAWWGIWHLFSGLCIAGFWSFKRQA
ncbi:MAG: BASS family bile acid:Na+ symporter [Limisphaerales bacterium]|jgi:BASS family bile acid:Na+ symporter